MSDITFKIRITSPDPNSAELLRTALRAVFGPALTLAKARKGSNPKYADRPDVLAYGELELSAAELHAAAGAPPGPATSKKRAPRAKKPAPAPAPAAYTQQTISLAPVKPRRRKAQP